MESSDWTVRWQRIVILFLFSGAAVLVLPSAVESFMLPKATLLVAGAIVVVALWASRAMWTRRLYLPVSLSLLAAVVLAVGLLTATVTSPRVWTSLVGFYARYTGLVPYLGYLVIFLAVASLADVPFVRSLGRVAVGTMAAVVSYGFLQAAGVEPLGFEDIGLGTTYSFFGNVNFSAAWVGIVSAFVLMTSLDPEESRLWRWSAAALLPLALVYVLLTQTVQGVVVLVVSTGAVLAVAASGEGSALRGVTRAHPVPVASVVAVAVVALAATAFLSRSFLAAQLDASLVERPEFWAAAVDMFQDHPVFGTGLDTYAHNFLAYRPASHALANSVATTDAPHSVPLGMLSNGGLVLGLAYLAFVVVIGVALVRAALHLTGPERLALAGAGGAWLGYQAQSLISFDVPPVAMLHFLAAGTVVALAGAARWRSVRVPGTPVAARVNRRGVATGDVLVPTSARVGLAVIGVLAVAVLWFVAMPLRADLVAASASPLTKTGQYELAAQRFATAADLNPSAASYAFLEAQSLAALGRGDEAVAAAVEAARRDPGTVQYPLFAGRTLQALGDVAGAQRWYLEAVARDPRNPDVLNEVAQAILANGDAATARDLLQRSVALRPDPEALALLRSVPAA